ncbi:4-alpha-glucanotransferase [Rouxiella badensis]|uniref:4-alpha-glucanotransferase n=1 Tax=Rouxiella badensis TaxID=1646377 RepID=UPI001D13A49D|nr:4-alpha-glucanotransferase [Rouxiella badensis]MCC3720380.1 4-alpha-glucanotransferase [Rouxiella badensis]MCC3730218.1 4-alpha-glucanotransferase [Rouxiella badensis]MCC3741662.1 4-alpha-glucanotransferase [Rouxiella badensis]
MRGEQLELAAKRAGILDSFINMVDEVQSVSAETKQALLEAMGRDEQEPDVGPLSHVKVFIVGEPVDLSPRGEGQYRWQLTLENGDISEGTGIFGESLELGDDYMTGYHHLTLKWGEEQWGCRIIVAPERCYEPEALKSGEKLWGACVQLYTLRSENNWGVGDFGDLKQMVEQLGQRGGAFVGLNPIHALYPANPLSASPYSPSSRRWLNVVYVDVNAVEEFQQSESAQSWWQCTATRDALKQVRSVDYVDYVEVMRLKITALELAWQTFRSIPEASQRKRDFRAFVLLGGESLKQQAVFDALHVHLNQTAEGQWGWPVWPKPYRDPHHPGVHEFVEHYYDEVEFYLWLQWLAHVQFASCYEASLALEMPIGLYRDLAVGVAEGGAETWCNRSLYCMGATVGAPPDILGPQGQNWGLPPLDPHVMRARAYQPFIDLLRSNMGDCGALRIDHVMGLLRLWWIPKDEHAGFGAYVSYPLRDLLGVLALESQRHLCMVIGEDLGTVPKEIVASLRDSGVYSYKVLYFEHDKDLHYRAPEDYVVQAMATITTHDLPTLRGYWQDDDLSLGEKLGIYPDEAVLAHLRRERALTRQALLDALHRHHCVPKSLGTHAERMPMSPALNRGLQRYVAESASALLGLQPEDWLDMNTPVNVPGTSSEYPNWRRKLTMSLEEMFADERINLLLKDVDKRRRRV